MRFREGGGARPPKPIWSFAGITSVIWATGYDFNFAWVKLPVFDEEGYPIQALGVTQYPGLYFLGLPWLTTAASESRRPVLVK